MRSKLAAIVIVAALSAGTGHAQNQIPNWEFDQQVTLTSLWNLWRSEHFTGLSIVDDARMSGRYAMKVDIGPGPFDPLQVFRSYLKLEQGKTYYISFMAKADAPRPVRVQLQARTLYNWQVYWTEPIQLTTEVQTFNFEYTHTGATVGGTGVFNNDIDFHFLLAGNGTDLYLDRIWLGTEPPPALDKTIIARAYEPVPDDGDGDIRVDPTLSWGPGVYAQTHNVYLADSFDDVNTATIAQAVSKGQTGTTYKVTEPLEYGKTYYWRVDEVNAPPDATVFKGDVWSFTVEPYTYPITGVTATASSSDKTTTGPANTVNGSGLANDLHSTASDAMWLSSMTGAQPSWIRYAFDKVYKLDELWVWNYNAEFEPVLGYGLKDVTIEYSTDGTTWTALKDVQFAQATAAAGYAHNTVVKLDGAMARYVRLTANSNWSAVGLQQYGLSEVRFFYLPVEARSPQPAQYAENVSVDAVLDWRPGREATSHTVSYGTDKAAVAGGTATTRTVTDHGLDVGPFDFGTTYYWKVDEAGDVTYPGSVWSFTTQQFVAVEDFESYTDDEGSRIYEGWIDGWTNNTGSTVGYLQAPFAERTIVHGGKQSMPFAYDNANQPYYSEAERTFDAPMDWTVNGADTLALFVQGVVDNGAAPLYITIQDRTGKKATVTHPDPAVTTATTWTEWRIPLSDITGVNLAAVKKLTLGVGDRANPKPGAAGMLYIDDILFGKPILPVGLVAHYTFEDSVDDISGNGHHGTILGSPTYVDGPAGLGKAMLFPGTAGNAVYLGTFNPSEKTGMLSVALWAKWNGLSTQWQGLIGKRDTWAAGETMWQIEANQTTGVLSFQRHNISVGSGNQVLPVGEWTHIAVTFDKTTGRFYVNGAQTGSGTWSFGPDKEAAVHIGADNSGGGNPFNGALDDVRVYDIVLTPAEILALAGK